VEPPTRGLPPPDLRSLCPLSSAEFVEPHPHPRKNPGYATAHMHAVSRLRPQLYFCPTERLRDVSSDSFTNCISLCIANLILSWISGEASEKFNHFGFWTVVCQNVCIGDVCQCCDGLVNFPYSSVRIRCFPIVCTERKFVTVFHCCKLLNHHRGREGHTAHEGNLFL
jgi:hypothetical protein